MVMGNESGQVEPASGLVTNGNGRRDAPLGLPEGSVRALQGLIALVGAIILYAMFREVPDWLVAITAGSLGSYTAMRGQLRLPGK